MPFKYVCLYSTCQIKKKQKTVTIVNKKKCDILPSSESKQMI